MAEGNICPTCGHVYIYHVEHRMTCANGHHWSAPWANMSEEGIS